VIRSHLVFVGTLLFSPVIAILAVTTGDPWMWPGVAVSGALLAGAATRSFLALRAKEPGARPAILRMRMMGVTATVAIASWVLVVVSLVVAIRG
jgi:hypothetical protein